jgi:hypothetical protein
VVASLESNQASLAGRFPQPCRHPALAACGMREIDKPLGARISSTGGADLHPNPGL